MFFTVLFFLVDNIVINLISYCEQISILNLFKINVFLYDMDQLCLVLVCFFAVIFRFASEFYDISHCNSF